MLKVRILSNKYVSLMKTGFPICQKAFFKCYNNVLFLIGTDKIILRILRLTSEFY